MDLLLTRVYCISHRVTAVVQARPRVTEESQHCLGVVKAHLTQADREDGIDGTELLLDLRTSIRFKYLGCMEV